MPRKSESFDTDLATLIRDTTSETNEAVTEVTGP